MIEALLILLRLFPLVLEMVKTEKDKGKGRSQVVESTLKQFNIVRGRAEKARDDARDKFESDGVRSDERYKRG